MTVPLSVWLLGSGAEPWTEHLSDCLAAQGAMVERLSSTRAMEWLSAGAMPAVRAMPHLVVLPLELAAAEDWALLRLIDRSVPWRLVPRAVVAHGEAIDDLDTAYGLGVSSLVVLPPRGPSDAFDPADSFARYWTRTARVPIGELLLA